MDNGKDWILTSLRLPLVMKNQVEKIALENQDYQSEIIRQAIMEYFVNHAVTDEEKEAAKVMVRRKNEKLKLEIPKDHYDSFLFPVRVRQLVRKTLGEWREAEFLDADCYDVLIEFVEGEIKVITGNPQEELITKMLRKLIAELEDERLHLEMKQAE